MPFSLIVLSMVLTGPLSAIQTNQVADTLQDVQQPKMQDSSSKVKGIDSPSRSDTSGMDNSFDLLMKNPNPKPKDAPMMKPIFSQDSIAGQELSRTNSQNNKLKRPRRVANGSEPTFALGSPEDMANLQEMDSTGSQATAIPTDPFSDDSSSLDHEEFISGEFQRNFCPFTDRCRERTAGHFSADREDMTPCCLPCSCEASCQRKGSCCPDVDLQTPEDVPATELSNCLPAVYPRDQTGSRVQGYDVVNDCPGGYQNRSVWQRCLGETPEIFLDLVFVTDNETNRIYANRFCAQCHGVTDMVHWGIKEAICLDFDHLHFLGFLLDGKSSYDVFTTVIDLQCNIEFKPPEGSSNVSVERELCYLQDQMIGYCNKTGQWDNYSEPIQSMCRSGHLAPYMQQSYDEDTVTTTYYRNLCCYLCNVRAALAREVTPNATCFAPHHGSGSTLFPPLTAILDLDPLLRDTKHDNWNPASHRCVDVNQEQGECVLLRCPILTVQQDRDCVQVFRDLTGVDIAQTFNVRFHYSMQILQDPNMIFAAIERYFIFESIFVANKCLVSHLAVFLDEKKICLVSDEYCELLVDASIQTHQTACLIPRLVQVLYWHMKNEMTAEIDSLHPQL